MAPFEVDWGDAPERGVTASRVVPSLDLSEQSHARLGLGLEAPAVDQFAFQARKEALRHRVVVGVADTAHRGTNAHLRAALPEGDAGVLRALIAVMNDLARPALSERHIQSCQNEIRAHLLADRPAHDATAPDIQHDG